MTQEENEYSMEKATPGSKYAQEHGCVCPVLDNAHGKGILGSPGVYWMRADCPLHGKCAPEEYYD